MFKKLWKLLDGKKRRIAVIGGAATSIGALTGYVPLTIVGTIITAVFGSADQVDRVIKKKNGG
jgi:type IV secretory pathway VirB2 component (pilin)